jgi:hypothetical protein
VSERDPNPAPNPLVTRLTKAGSENETEDVVALIGFVGPGRDGHFRLYPELQLQRWLDLPAGEIVDSHPVDADDPLESRTVVWVKRAAMIAPIFNETAVRALEAEFADDGWMSTWPLIPDSRLVAARILDLIAPGPEGEYEEGGPT